MDILFATERLKVRKFTPDDWEDLAEILTDKEVTYFEPYETFTREACVQEAENFSKSDEFFAVVLDKKKCLNIGQRMIEPSSSQRPVEIELSVAP